MNLRHLATKGFDSDIVIRRSLMYPGTQLVVLGAEQTIRGDEVVREDTIQFNRQMPESVNLAQPLLNAKERVLEGPFGSIVSKGGDDIVPLSACYDYTVQSGDTLNQVGIPTGISFDALFEDIDSKEQMAEIAAEMFPLQNPNTGVADMRAESFYAPYVPLVVLSGCMTPQMKDGEAYFNPDGVVTVAEFLDGLNAIKFGCNANNMRRKTLDNLSTEADYFNEGYNSVLRGLSSPFFNLYTREELLTPITRLELAYITVICWSQFMDKYNNLYGGAYYLGVTFDWEVPSEVLSRYEDGFAYKVSRISIDEEHVVISLNAKDYRSDRTMAEYRDSLRSGVSALPLPMFMSMVELGVLDLFFYEGDRLDPLKEVSRGELCYFLSRLAKHFPIKNI